MSGENIKKILFVVAHRDFRDEEFFVPSEYLKKAGHEVLAASDGPAGDYAIGVDGGEIKIDYSISETQIQEFDFLIFAGGPGALKHLDNEASYKLINEAQKSGIRIAAICIAPVILAKAGILKGRKATVWTSETDKSAVKILEENGVKYEKLPVVSDGAITADGPVSALKFAEKIVQMLQ